MMSRRFENEEKIVEILCQKLEREENKAFARQKMKIL